LGSQQGPLRLLTRAVTYSLVFGIGYGLGLGLFFGIACGVATGVTIAIELQRQTSRGDHYSLPWESLFSAIRGIGFAAALYLTLGFRFAAAFGVIITCGQVFAYTRGMRPALATSTSRRPRLTGVMLLGSIVRTLGYIVTALICDALVRPVYNIESFALRVGLVTGVATTIGGMVTPFIEYYADRMPERRMGAVGIVLVLFGFTLQSLQYWLSLFDIRVT